LPLLDEKLSPLFEKASLVEKAMELKKTQKELFKKIFKKPKTSP